MLGFLFGKSGGTKPAAGKGARQVEATQAKIAPVAAAVAVKPPAVPLDQQLAALAALADGADGILQAALSTAPDEVRGAALARLSATTDLVRVAIEARVADTRHAAVVLLQDEASLNQVAQHARTRDKRVFKTARDRLDGFARERERLAMQTHWLEVAEQMAAQSQTELSRVVELERVWAALQPDADVDQRFQQARTALRAQLQAQASERRDAERKAQADAEEALLAAAQARQAAAEAQAQAQAESAAAAAAAAATEALPEAQAQVLAADAVAEEGGERTEHADGSAPKAAAALPADGVRASRSKPGRTQGGPAVVSPEQREALAAAVAALEHALEEGHLQEAETRLQALSVLQSQMGGASGTAGGRIRRAAEEIARLRAWRRWGGQQARDHLCEAAEALPQRDLPVEELGRAVRALRAQWQEMAAQESGVPHALWERFDAACERAWEPVRVHFAAQAERRLANQARREEVLLRLEAQVQALAQPPVDWRAVSALLAETVRNWRTLGPVDRKISRPLEQRYTAAIEALEQPLRTVRANEENERLALIRAATLLGEQAEGRDTVTRLRGLQADWQARSRGVPLPRAREQALWEQFRTACDSVFASRDAARQAEQAERSAHLQAQDEAFRKRSESWRAIGAAASLCAEAEQALCQGGMCDPTTLESRWQALPVRPAGAQAALQARQQAVLTGNPAAVQQAVAGSAAALAAGLLELEIGLGLPSPAHLQAERREVQLRKLADRLRSGGRADTDSLQSQLFALLALPCPDGGQQARLLAVLQALTPQPSVSAERPPRHDAPPRADRGGRGDRPAGADRPQRPPRAR